MENNKLLDKWTVVHIGTGLLVGLSIKQRKIAYPLIIGFELIEKGFLEEVVFKEKEGIKNILSDIAIGIISYEAGKKL